MGRKKVSESEKVESKNSDNSNRSVEIDYMETWEWRLCYWSGFIQYGLAKSSVCTILKKKEPIKEATVAKDVIAITKQRSQALEEVVKMLRI